MGRNTILLASLAILLTGCFKDKELLGEDVDNNGIRDDYELAIQSSGLPIDVIDTALAAGKAYQALMIQSVDDVQLDKENAKTLIANLVLAKRCQISKQEIYGEAWQESTFFNSFDRIEAKFKTQAALSLMMEGEDPSLPTGDACANLMNL